MEKKMRQISIGKPILLGLCLATFLPIVKLQADILEHAADETTKANWRTSVALETDGEYGTDGFILYGNTVDGYTGGGNWDATLTNADNLSVLPGYITDVLPDPPHNHWGGGAPGNANYGNYGLLENPDNPSETHSAGVLLRPTDQRIDLTIQRATSSAFRLTLIIGGGDGGGFLSDTQAVTIDAGGAGSVSTTHTGLAEVGVSYKSFDIGSGTDDIIVTLEKGADNCHLTGLAFDSNNATVATSPNPADNQTNLIPYLDLHWNPAVTAQSQKLYFGSNVNSLNLLTALDSATTVYDALPLPLDLNTEYFWRIDAQIGGSWNEGSLWSFTTRSTQSCDLNNDFFINIADLKYFTAYWLQTDCITQQWCENTDFNYSNNVDLADYNYLSTNWLSSVAQDVKWDFETGDLQDWDIVQGDFGMFLCDRQYFHSSPGTPYNKQGTWFLSTLETSTYDSNDSYTGIAESPVFHLSEPEMSFLIGGGNSSTAYLALCTLDNDFNDTEILIANGSNSETMHQINWSRPDLVGQKLFLKLVDQNTGGWGHITFDDFSAFGVIDMSSTYQRRSKIYQEQIGLSSVLQLVDDLSDTFGDEYVAGPAIMAQIEEYQLELARIIEDIKNGDPTALQRLVDLENEITAFKTTVTLSNPLIQNQPILFVVRNQYRSDHHNTATFFPAYDNEYNNGSYQSGGALKKIDLSNSNQATTLLETSNGVIRDPEVYFDGDKIVFAKRNNHSDSYHIYEINADGSGLVQLTWADRVDDLDPMYLPDDSIVFSSTREPKYVHCNRHIMSNLFKMESDGANIHQISNNPLFDFNCSLMQDGRIIYSRWEYVDRNFGDAQSLWTCLPDGRNHSVYFGNNTISPGALIDPRDIPGTQQAVCIFSSCHDRPWGALAVIDRRLGVDLPQPGKANPVKHIWPESAIDLCGGWDGSQSIPTPYAGQYGFDNMKNVNPKYEDPYPLYDPDHPDSTGKYFLVSRMTGAGEKMGIYLVDVFGNETLLHQESDSRGCYDPMPLNSRIRPAQLPTIRKYGDENGQMQNGKLYLMNAYEGSHMEGVEPGSVKYLRILEATEKLTWTHPSWPGQGQVAPGAAWHDFYSKKILGVVPVEQDGSAYFEVPAETMVYFQLLDDEGKMVQSMRSGTIVQPGEMIGCVGCHEHRTDAVPIAKNNSYLPTAIQRDPSAMNGWHGQTKRFNFLQDVQPVFTAKCVSCHGFDTVGGPKAGLLLEPDKTPYFNTSYNELWRKGHTAAVGAGFAPIMPAKSWGSHAGSLISALEDADHADLNLSTEELDRIITWLDINSPYYPVYTSAYPNNPAGRSPLTNSQLSTLSSLTGYNFGTKQPPCLSFDRPQKSICLSPLDGTTYDAALAIIQAGQANLNNNPRGDMPGHQPNSTDLNRIQKYLDRQAIEMLNRESIRQGTKNYD